MNIVDKLPDAIHAGRSKEYTIVPKEILRNPKLSCKAKTILCILLSNKEGWKSYQSTIEKMLKEGADAIASALKELEQFGYLQRNKYRNIKTKVWVGSFWAYTDTPFIFDTEEHLQILKEKGYECPFLNKRPDLEKPDLENQRLIILNINKNKIKNINNITPLPGKDILENVSFSKMVRTNSPKQYKEKAKERQIKEYIPFASKLAAIIEENKNIKILQTPSKINAWAKEFKILIEKQAISKDRALAALDWYQKNIGGQYIPVIQCGKSFREKFVKIEDAIKRSSQASSQAPSKTWGTTGTMKWSDNREPIKFSKGIKVKLT